MNELIYLVPLFFFIALLYSSAGFGGGSSYLATLSFFSIGFVDLRMLALICNIVVVSSSVFLFSKFKQTKWARIWPLIILSVPLAFLGGKMRLEAQLFYLILGFTLLVSALVMMVDVSKEVKKLPRYFNGIIGGGIGFLSGVVGIGGGIFLSPILHLTKWDTPKVIAATSATFILFNSIAGLVGQISANGFHLERSLVLALVAAVLCGGQIGTRLTLFQFSPVQVKRITAVVILIVAIRLLVKNI